MDTIFLNWWLKSFEKSVYYRKQKKISRINTWRWDLLLPPGRTFFGLFDLFEISDEITGKNYTTLVTKRPFVDQLCTKNSYILKQTILLFVTHNRWKLEIPTQNQTSSKISRVFKSTSREIPRNWFVFILNL